jgi:hypothetical protein
MEMRKIRSTVAALREQAATGSSVPEIFRSLRDELEPGQGFGTHLLLLHQAFDVPRDTLRRTREWTGWSDEGRMTDAELVELLSPLVVRPAGFDRFSLRPDIHRRQSAMLPRTFDRPFQVQRYIVSHQALTLRSEYQGDVLDLSFIGVRAMRLRADFDHLVISNAADRPDVRDFAALPEPWDATQHYLMLSDGVHEGFVVCGAFGVDPGGRELPEMPWDRPVGRAESIPLPVPLGFMVYTRAFDAPARRLELNNGARRITFSGVLAMQLLSSFRPSLTIADGADRPDVWEFAGLPPGGAPGHRVLTLTDGTSEGFVVCESFEIDW